MCSTAQGRPGVEKESCTRGCSSQRGFSTTVMCCSVVRRCLQDHNGSIAITCIGYLVGGLLAIGTSTGRIMVHSEAGLVSSLDLNAPADQQGSKSCASSSSGTQQAPASPGKVAAAKPGSQAGASQQASPHPTCMHGVQALVQRGRGFVAAGSNWDVYLFDPPAATTNRQACKA